MGINLPTVDATCARHMGIIPHSLGHVPRVENWLGPIEQPFIHQVGERVTYHQLE